MTWIGRVRKNAQEQVTEIFRSLDAQTPRNLSETWRNRQISGGLKAGAMPVKDYNACTIENNTRPP